MKIRRNYTCPLELVHDIIRGKWKTIIIFQLRKGTQTFSQLCRAINGITEKMLLEQLRELQQFELVNRYSRPGFPLHVEYSLTPQGEKVLSAILILQEVGIDYMVKHGMEEVLKEKGIAYGEHTKK